MKKIIMALMILFNLVPQATPPEVTIDRIEDNDIAVVAIYYQDKIKTVDIPVKDFNEPVKEGTEISASVATGSIEWLDGNDWYQFKSHDDTVWWALTTEDIGFTPEENKTYTLIYYDNNTTECTECEKELECECEIYDDIFFAIIK